MSQYVCERLTFNMMVGMSELKRKERARGVTGPSIDVEAYDGVLYYSFNFKSLENTTGRRHKGYVKFFKPPNPKVSLGKVECLVDCTCPDFKYTWAWALKQRGSAPVGSNSLNGATNRAPKIKNPRSVPGLCKHLLALKDYIINSASQFPGTDVDDSTLIKKMIERNRKFTLNPGQQVAARGSSELLKKKAQAKATGIPFQQNQPKPPMPPVAFTTKKPAVAAPVEPEVTPPNTNPTNSRNESVVIFMKDDTLPQLLALLEDAESDITTANPPPPDVEVHKEEEEAEDGLSILKSIRDLIGDVKEMLSQKMPEEEKEAEVPELPEPPVEPAPKSSENDHSADKENI